ncbi:dnaJ homolog subfamily C member 15 isoform X2 [Rhinoderma darwinii]|uniref:dnaJ homolog subfamily C member 15 isoform X2 n=1 Tax=Rhinoderma darwinii TaxID=43563 RepID=UPI003F680487
MTSYMGGTMIAVGLGVAAAAFAGRFAFQLWKPLGQVIMENAKKISNPSLSYYYKGGFEQKMSRREASLVLGVSPSASKSKIRTAHRKIMILNHPDKGGSPYIATKINEAKDLLQSSAKQ